MVRRLPKCSAPGCRNFGSHEFPIETDLRELWEIAIDKDNNFKSSRHSRLCSRHFKRSDYIEVRASTGVAYHRYLKKTAVPSKFPKKTIVNNARENNEINKSRQQISRHLKKDVVPSIFPWTKKESTLPQEAGQQEKSTRTSSQKQSALKNNVMLSQNTSKQQANNSTKEIKPRDRSVRLRNRKAYLANLVCAVPQCNVRPSNEITLHMCPNNAAVRNEWADALRVSYQYARNMVACSLHFMKTDFIHSKNSGRVLKHSAVPSRNLPLPKKVVVPVKHKFSKKVESPAVLPNKQALVSLASQETMTDTVTEATNAAEQGDFIRECRACLKRLDDKKSCCYVFQAWSPHWEGMEATIAEDLAKLANVEISITDRHSKMLCHTCYQKLLDAATFASSVRKCDLFLRMRYPAEIDREKIWPKPIQVDKNINDSVYSNPMNVEIKQEVLSDEEISDPVNVPVNAYIENDLSNVDIKIEPEEFVDPQPMTIKINGTISLDPLNSENKDRTNGIDYNPDMQLPEVAVKQEPLEPGSEGEQETEQAPDLPLECLLCTKSFNSVTGLKAHVIAQHSYKTVKRKANGSVSPEKKRLDKYQCAICRRNFQTSTDLMVHETCHNKHACYGCNEKFDSFELLTRHRLRCKSSSSVQKLKTLDDVKRALPEDTEEYLDPEMEYDEKTTEDCEMKDLDNKERLAEIVKKEIGINEIKECKSDDLKDSSMKLHLEIHSTKSETDSMISDADMQVETLKK